VVRGRWTRALVLVAIALTARGGRAAVSQQAAEAINQYRAALVALERRSRGTSVEDVYEMALALAPPLISPAREDDSIEHLSDTEVAALQKQLRGLQINSHEVLFVLPDARFFLELSRKHGGPADIAFFKEMLATYPVAAWIPTYIEQLSEVSACTAFQSGQLVRRYGGWLKYARRYPKAYQSQVADELQKIEEETRSTCSCGKTWASYLRELRNFNKHFPKNPARNDIAKLIDDAEHGRSKVRLGCVSG
jgi:hypothetical protein